MIKLYKKIRKKISIIRFRTNSKKLKKRLLKKTVLGFGFNRLPYDNNEGANKKPHYEQIKAIVDAYIEGGCNYFETGYNYMKYQSENIVKECLVNRYNRNDYILCDKLPIRNKVVRKKSYSRVLKEQLKRCGVDYFDIYLLHNVNRVWYERNGKDAFEFLQKTKKQRKAKLIGFSFHDKAETLDTILCEHPEIDIVQLQINYQDWESDAIQSKHCLEIAKKHNKVVTVMEPLKGGNLVNRLPIAAEQIIRDAGWTPAEFGLKFVLSKDCISVVLSGMGAIEQVKENISFAASSKNFNEGDERIVENVLEIIKEESEIDCTNCGYCLDVCPKKIPINVIFQLMNNETKKGIILNRNARLFYRGAISGQGKSSDCIKCGMCESVCSQLIPICEHLENAKKIFE